MRDGITFEEAATVFADPLALAVQVEDRGVEEGLQRGPAAQLAGQPDPDGVL